MGDHDRLKSGIFITFSGNCKQALSFYQSCFGGRLQLETFEKELQGYSPLPVISGSLVSERIVIYGSDLVHNEGRIPGNYLSIYLHCENSDLRKELISKLEPAKAYLSEGEDDALKLIEVIDAFGVRWILGINP